MKITHDENSDVWLMSADETELQVLAQGWVMGKPFLDLPGLRECSLAVGRQLKDAVRDLLAEQQS